METPRATVAEFGARFGSATERREELFGQFAEWCELIRATGVVVRAWVYGSFPSAKPGPNDLDVVLLVRRGFLSAQLPQPQRQCLDPDLTEALWSVHLYVITEDLAGVYLDGLLDLLRYSRDGAETLVEVLL